MMTFKERTQHICLRTNTTLPKTWLQHSIADNINVEILNEQCKKISVLLQQLTFELNDKIYFLQEQEICFGRYSLAKSVIRYN